MPQWGEVVGRCLASETVCLLVETTVWADVQGIWCSSKKKHILVVIELRFPQMKEVSWLKYKSEEEVLRITSHKERFPDNLFVVPY